MKKSIKIIAMTLIDFTEGQMEPQDVQKFFSVHEVPQNLHQEVYRAAMDIILKSNS